MKALKFLVVITALVVFAGVVADSWAQCPNPRIFRSSGKFGLNVKVDVTGTDAGANEIGRLWDTQNSAFSNSNLADGSFCPASLWWLGADPIRIVDGALTSGACVQTGCPTRDLTVVLEDYPAPGPPGIGGDAFYVGFAVTETPAEGRWYDYGLVDGVTAATTLPMIPFPVVDIVASDRSGGNVLVTVDYQDQGNHVHTWLNGGIAPTNSVVAEWHLMKATGLTDPGRDRNSWTQFATIGYVDGGDTQQHSVPCTDTIQNEFLAVGIGFAGGTGPVVDSALVGQAIALECDPNLADPEVKPDFKQKEANTELQANPGRSGGRR